MDNELIRKNMEELENILDYKFDDIEYLSKAMNSSELEGNTPKNKKDYENSALATVGDAVLSLILCDKLYNEGCRKEEITNMKSNLCNNEILHSLLIDKKYNIINFAHNQHGFYGKTSKENQVPHSKDHTTYIEAIIGAIYYDGGYEKVKEWIINWLLPKLEKSFSLIKEKAKSTILDNIDKLQISELGIERIRENLNLQNEDILEWCKNKICSDDSVVEKENKNYYIKVDNCIITVNVSRYTIITAHKTK